VEHRTQRSWGRGWTLGVIVLLCMAALGCGAAGYEEVGRFGAKGAVEGTLEGFRAIPRSDFDGFMKDLALRQAAHDLAKSMVIGASDGLTDQRVDEKTKALVDSLLVSAKQRANETVKQLIDEQGPALQLSIKQTLTASLYTAIYDAGTSLGNNATAEVPQVTDNLVLAAVRSLDRALSSPEADDVGKQVRGSAGALAESVGAGAVRGIRNELMQEDTKKAIAALTQEATKQIVTDVGSALRPSSSSVWIASTFVAGALLLLCGLGLVLFVRRSLLTARALETVAEVINKHEKAPLDAKTMKHTIQQKAALGGVGTFLHTFLKDRGL
jgi:hypothetical protein